MIKTSLKNRHIRILMQVISLVLMFFGWGREGFGQSHAEIRNVDFTVRNDSMFVVYDLVEAGKGERFDISLKVISTSGKTITPLTLGGDVGKNRSGGKLKQIVWNIAMDNVAIDEEIAVEVIATSLAGEVKFVSRGKAVLLSAVVPGLGLTRLNNGGPYWIMAIAVYGAAAGSYLYFTLADQNYTKYLEAQTESERNALHATVESQKTISNVFMYTAGAVWLGNMIWTLAAHNKTKPGDKGLSFGGAYDPRAKAPVFTLKYNF